MIIPIRCFTCGKVIGNKWKEYKRLQEEGEENGVILSKLGCKYLLKFWFKIV